MEKKGLLQRRVLEQPLCGQTRRGEVDSLERCAVDKYIVVHYLSLVCRKVWGICTKNDEIRGVFDVSPFVHAASPLLLIVRLMLFVCVYRRYPKYDAAARCLP